VGVRPDWAKRGGKIAGSVSEAGTWRCCGYGNTLSAVARAGRWSGRERESKAERSGGEKGGEGRRWAEMGGERRRQEKTAYFDARLVLAGLLGWGLIGRAGRGAGGGGVMG